MRLHVVFGVDGGANNGPAPAPATDADRDRAAACRRVPSAAEHISPVKLCPLCRSQS